MAIGITNSPGKASSGDGFKDWKANTSYTTGEKLVHEGQAYEATANFTSGAVFSDTNLSKYLPLPLTAAQIQDIIDSYEPVFTPEEEEETE